MFSFASRWLGSWIASAVLIGGGISTVETAATFHDATPVTTPVTAPYQKASSTTAEVRKTSSVIFAHGDVSWLPALAAEAGWPEEAWDTLAQIILRESGGCPNRRGGDMVDKKCNITGVSEWTHRSDSGLLQINGVNYDPTRNKFAPICLQMDVCVQEPLMNPVTNLKAGKLIFDYWEKAAGDGWIPWDTCNRNNSCKRTKKLKP